MCPLNMLKGSYLLDAVKFQDKEYVMTLIGGDQLTVSRIRGALKIRGNSGRSEYKLDGFFQ